jgi:hypothetical protein
MIGVAASSAPKGAILVAGVAGMVAGAMSMAVGEYVSVSSQRDAEQADIEREKGKLTEQPEAELRELALIYVKRGLDNELAMGEADRLTVAAGTPAPAMMGERPLMSVANLPWQDGIDFLRLAPAMGLVTQTTRYPLNQANQSLADLRAGRFRRRDGPLALTTMVATAEETSPTIHEDPL